MSRETINFTNKSSTHVISGFQYFVHIFVHIVMIQCHEQCVYHDAECDEEFDERIEYDERDPFLKLEPCPATIPNAK